MKKFRFLSLGALALLALTGCSSEGGEITEKEAKAMYKVEKTAGYVGEVKVGPASTEVIETYDKAIIEVEAYFTDFAVKHLLHYAQVAVTPLECFFDYDLVETKSLGKLFGESITYTVEGKKVSTSFTGSHSETIEKREYSMALYFTSRYNKLGLLEHSAFNYAIASMKSGAKEVDTKIKGSCSLDITWSKVA